MQAVSAFAAALPMLLEGATKESHLNSAADITGTCSQLCSAHHFLLTTRRALRLDVATRSSKVLADALISATLYSSSGKFSLPMSCTNINNNHTGNPLDTSIDASQIGRVVHEALLHAWQNTLSSPTSLCLHTNKQEHSHSHSHIMQAGNN